MRDLEKLLNENKVLKQYIYEKRKIVHRAINDIYSNNTKFDLKQGERFFIAISILQENVIGLAKISITPEETLERIFDSMREVFLKTKDKKE